MVAAGAAKLPLLLLACFAAPVGASAHLLDAYLQATLVSVEPGDVRLRVHLTPGVAVADQVLAAIDRDHDGTISAGEASVYAEALRRDLTAGMDGRNLELAVAAIDVPAPAELRTGSGVIRAEFSLAPGSFAAGAHRLTLESRHFRAIGAYLVNATRPKSAAVRITRQHRNDDQSVAEIDFTFEPTAGRSGAVGASVAALLVAAAAVGLWLVRKRSARGAAPALSPRT